MRRFGTGTEDVSASDVFRFLNCVLLGFCSVSYFSFVSGWVVLVSFCFWYISVFRVR